MKDFSLKLKKSQKEQIDNLITQANKVKLFVWDHDERLLEKIVCMSSAKNLLLPPESPQSKSPNQSQFLNRSEIPSSYRKETLADSKCIPVKKEETQIFNYSRSKNKIVPESALGTYELVFYFILSRQKKCTSDFG